MPPSAPAVYDGYYNTTPECWSVYTQVIGAEFGNAVLFGQSHQLTVDTYAVQHPGGRHPDKSIGIHLSGLHLMLEAGCKPPTVAPLLQRLAGSIHEWPHFVPPHNRGSISVFDAAMADSPREHIRLVRAWAEELWRVWSPHHAAVARLLERHLG